MDQVITCTADGALPVTAPGAAPAPRRWTLLITSQGHGLVGEYGSKFEHGKRDHERVDVVEVVAGQGASTVLTDERIDQLARTACLDGSMLGKRSDYWRTFARAIEREVAAQAGQEREFIAYGGKRMGRTHLAELERDAVRYRWIRSQDTSLETQQRDKGIVNGSSCYHEVEGIRELKWGAELDEAVDAAMLATSPVAAQADQVAVPEFDLYMRSRVADLLHLLQFATISTPSHGDADQAKLVMADLRRNLAKSAPSPAKESK